MIWICPIYKSPNDDNGYDISDYQDIMEDFGTMQNFDRLLEEVRRRGMKLILDWSSITHPTNILGSSNPAPVNKIRNGIGRYRP